jgi:hypothetical protein
MRPRQVRVSETSYIPFNRRATRPVGATLVAALALDALLGFAARAIADTKWTLSQGGVEANGQLLPGGL